MTNVRINKSDIFELAANIERELQEKGFKVQLLPHFCYGAFGYYFNFDTQPKRQLYTGLGTKKQLYSWLNDNYYITLNNTLYFKGV